MLPLMSNETPKPAPSTEPASGLPPFAWFCLLVVLEGATMAYILWS